MSCQNRRITDDPPFEALYGHEDAIITPRMAFSLWIEAVTLPDHFRTDLSAGGTWLRDELPLIAQPWCDDPDWLRRFLACFDVIAERLASGVRFEGLAECTGDEVAYLITARYVDFDEITATFPEVTLLPEDVDRDRDLGLAADMLLQDVDVEWLYEPALDGIEDPSGELASQLRVANLHPRDWFLPFPNAEG